MRSFICFILTLGLLASGCEQSSPPPVEPPALEEPPQAPTPPSAPRAVQATAEPGAVALTWLEPETNGGSALTGYRVEAEPREEAMEVRVEGQGARVTGLRPGTTYRFTVAALNAVGSGPAAAAVPVLLPDLPDAPTDVTAERGDGQARVTWVRPPSDGGRPITTYVVTAHPSGMPTEVSGLVLSTVVGGLTNGVPATFTVRAVTAVGQSAESTPSEAVVPAGLPQAPASVSATPGVRTVSVSWQAPVETGGVALTGYVVTARPGGVRREVEATATRATFEGLEDDTAYTFTVAARNEVGAGPGADSAPARTPTRPDAPGAVGAEPGVRTITVTWEPPAADGREPLTGYTVVALPSGVRADVEAGARTATLGGVPSTRAQTVTVTARNAVGEGPTASAAAPVRARPAPVEVTALLVPSEDTGCLSVVYRLRQTDGERADVVVEVDAGGGAFTRATQAGNAWHSGLTALTTSAQGREHAFRWNRSRDVPGAAASATVRVTATVPGTAPATRTVSLPLAEAARRCEVDTAASRVQALPADSRAMTHGDFDNDGKLDLVLLSFNSGPSLLRGLGNGSLEPGRSLGNTFHGGYAVASGDLDGDGVLDLVVAGTSHSVYVALGRGDGTFAEPVRNHVPTEAAHRDGAPVVTDLDGDGAPEVALVQEETALVLRHDGGGTLSVAFQHLFGYSRGPLVAGDFNEDGHVDLMMAGEHVHALYGQGGLRFSTDFLWPLGTRVPSAVAGDFNEDGHLDLAATVEWTDETAVLLLTGNGKGRFDAPVQLLHTRDLVMEDTAVLATGDFDGNGTQDLAYTQGYEETLTVLSGHGDGTFTSRQLVSGQAGMRIAAADFDGSGRPDLVVLARARRVQVLRDLEAPEKAPFGSVFVTEDFDGDGWKDVASLADSRHVQAHLTTATGAFTHRGPSPVGRDILALSAGRFDANATVDLLAIGETQTYPFELSLVLMRGNGDGTFTPGEALPVGADPFKAVAGDVDGDGDQDVVCATWRRVDGVELEEVRLLLNHGDGTFAPGVPLQDLYAPRALALADLDADGRAELLLSRSGISLRVELGVYEVRADGTVELRQTLSSQDVWSPADLLVRDLDRDGHVDVALPCSSRGGVLLLWGTEHGGLLTGQYLSSGVNTSGLSAVDVDGDGWVELLAGSPGSDSACVFPSQGDGGFGAATCFGTAPFAHVVTPLDVEHDGVPELLVGGGTVYSAISAATLLRPR